MKHPSPCPAPVRGPLARKMAFLFVFLGVVAAGCHEDPVPKPRGYFRLDLPAEGNFQRAARCGYSAEIPGYARLVAGRGTGTPAEGTCWSNLLFPGQRAAVHMTWRRISNDLPELVRDAHEFKDKHEVLATRIKVENIGVDSSRVYGTLFAVDGNVASPMVFYLTDSTENFLYGALYFDVRPNADSLAPVTARIRADLGHFARSLRWEHPAGAVQHVQ